MPTPSEELQIAIYNALIADQGVSGVVGSRVYDPRPKDAIFPCISFGPRDYLPDDMDCIAGREETLQIDCWTREGGRTRGAAALADKVKVALHHAELALGTHALAQLVVEAVRVMGDPDGITAHGVVTVTALIEER